MLCLYYIIRTLCKLKAIIKMKLKLEILENNPQKMEKGSSFDEPYIMKKNIIKFCYVYIIFHLPYMNFRMELKCN